jgi:tetratricopeptide (TPR) repeat protein
MRGFKRIGIVAATTGAMLVATASVSSAQNLKEVQTLNKQVDELYDAGKYAEAIPLAQRALAIREKALGSDHPDLVETLNNLAYLYHAQGRYAEAEPLFKRSLAIQEKVLGPDHPDVAGSLNSLGLLYHHQARYTGLAPISWRGEVLGSRYLI